MTGDEVGAHGVSAGAATPTETPPPQWEALRRYTTVARRSAVGVIRAYSTSFALASRLLPRRCALDIATVYALVRIADEVVDGVAAAAGLDEAEQRDVLRDLRTDVHEAIATGFSSDLVVHAFAETARRCGIGAELIDPFFDSMAMDLAPGALDAAGHRRYVHGSAEVVGLMCLRVFCRGRITDQRDIEPAAQALGAAFQNVNFLRDFAEDAARGRHYLPGPDGIPGELLAGGAVLTESTKEYWVARIDDDLTVADAGIALLPADCRTGVRAAHAIFAELNRRIAAAPAETLMRERVRVPDVVKARRVAGAVWAERVRPGPAVRSESAVRGES